MKLSYYPGCSLNSTAREFASSTEAVFHTLGAELDELADWCCCGATSGHSLDKYLSHALPLYNLIMAEASGNDELVVPCAACYNSLRAVKYFMDSGSMEAQELNEKAADKLGRRYRGFVKVRHIMDMLADQYYQGLLKEKIKHTLGDIPVASYYGCLLTRPPKIASFEKNPEQPETMDRLLSLAGAKPVSWTCKNECCGASLAIPRPNIVKDLTAKIINACRRAGATIIVTACPLCQTNLDSRQLAAENDCIPVLYITELLGMAMGLDYRPWLKKHLVDPLPVLREFGLQVAS